MKYKTMMMEVSIDNLDAQAPDGQGTSQRIATTEFQLHDGITAVSFNCGGLGSEFAERISSWVRSIPPNTSIIILSELKMATHDAGKIAQINQCLNEVLDHGGDGFVAHSALISAEHNAQMEAILLNNDKRDNSHTKGGMAVFVRRGIPDLKIAKVTKCNTTRLICIDFAIGFRIAAVYGPAQNTTLGKEAAGTYLMSKIDFVRRIMRPVMTGTSTIVMGDMNLHLGSRDDNKPSGASHASAAETELTNCMTERNFVDAVDEILPKGETPAPTYNFHSGATRPDRIIVPRAALLEKRAISSVSTIKWGLWPGHNHATLTVTFSPTRLARKAPAEIVSSRNPNIPPPEVFDEVASNAELLTSLADALDRIDNRQPNAPSQINDLIRDTILNEARHKHALRCEYRSHKAHHDPAYDEPSVRDALSKKCKILRLLPRVKKSLEMWETPTYVPDTAPVCSRNTARWAWASRKCDKIFREKHGAAAVPVPIEFDEPPSTESKQQFTAWMIQAQTLVTELEEATRERVDKLKMDLFVNTVNETASNMQQNLKRKIASLKSAVTRLETKREIPIFAVVRIDDEDAPEQRERLDQARAVKAAQFWEEIARETRMEPSDATTGEWEIPIDNAKPHTIPATTLLAPINVEEVRSCTKSAARSMPALNPITNNFFRLLFSKNESKEPQLVVLAKARSRICRTITRMFNTLLLRGAQPPTEWRSAEVVCLLKAGDPEDMANYRPISLLTALYKLYTSVITKRLSAFVEGNDILSESQGGGRPGRSTYQLIAALMANISFARAAEARGENHALHVLFLDLQKAYNSVPHWAIKRSLRHLGAPAQFVSSVMNLYQNLSSTIRIGAQRSSPFPEARGVRQGDTLSPLLWILFLNPLLQWWKIENIGHSARIAHAVHGDPVEATTTDVSFVDDMAVCISSEAQLSKACQMIDEFADFYGIRMGIKADASKTAIMDISGAPSLPCTIQEQLVPKIAPKGSYKYLGVPINAELDTTDAFERVRKSMLAASKILHIGPKLPPQMVTFFANQVIWPIAQYATRVIQFTNKQCETLNKIVRAAVRKSLRQFDLPNAIIHGPKSDPLGALGIVDLRIQQRIDFLSATASLQLRNPNPSLAWWRVLLHDSKSKNLFLGAVAPPSSRIRKTDLKQHPQVLNLWMSLKSTGTALVAVYDQHKETKATTRALIQRDKPGVPVVNAILQFRGLLAKTAWKNGNPHPRISRILNIQQRVPWGTPLAQGNAQTLVVATALWNEPRPTILIRIGRGSVHHVESYPTTSQHKGFYALQTIERVLMMCPWAVKRTVPTKIIILMRDNVDDLIATPTKALRKHELRPILERVQALLQQRTLKGTIVECHSNADFIDRGMRAPANTGNTVDRAATELLAARGQGASQCGYIPLLNADPFVLVKKETYNGLLKRPLDPTNAGLAYRAVVNQISVGDLPRKLKERAASHSNYARKHQAVLRERATMIGAPAPNQRHLVACKLAGASPFSSGYAKHLSRQDFIVRSNRAETNARLASRLPTRFKFWPRNIPTPHDLNVEPATDNMPDNFQELTKSNDDTATSEERNARFQPIMQQAISKKEKIALVRTAKTQLRKDEKLFRRFRHHTGAKCNRCNANSEETTRHLFLECPSSSPLLATMREETLARENARRQELSRAALTWRQLFTDSANDATYPGDDVSTYWVALGFLPARATREIETDNARRTFRASVAAEKNAADSRAYLQVRLALLRVNMEQGGPEVLGPALFPAGEIHA